MEDNVLYPLYGLKGLLYLFLPALTEDLYPYIIRYKLTVHKLPEKIIFYLRCRRKADLYLLKAQLQKQLKKLYLFLDHHRIDKRLIPVPEINAAPYRSLFDLLIAPLPLRVVNDRIFPVSLIV